MNFLGYHVYGNKAAVYVYFDHNAKQQPTLAFDAAFKRAGHSDYDWGAKLSVQLTPRELPVVTGVFLGHLPHCRFDQRGPSGKGFSIEHQGTHLFLNIWQGKGFQYQVRIDAADAFHVSAIALRACSALYDLPDAQTLAAIRACCKLQPSNTQEYS